MVIPRLHGRLAIEDASQLSSPVSVSGGGRFRKWKQCMSYLMYISAFLALRPRWRPAIVCVRTISINGNCVLTAPYSCSIQASDDLRTEPIPDLYHFSFVAQWKCFQLTPCLAATCSRLQLDQRPIGCTAVFHIPVYHYHQSPFPSR
jgi:hypothetical protein